MAQTADTPAPQATHSEVGHEAGGQSNFPPFDSATFPSQLLWLAITFGALYWFMAKKAWKWIKLINMRGVSQKWGSMSRQIEYFACCI